MAEILEERSAFDIGRIWQTDIIRFAELWYHADGFLEMAKGDRLPPPEPWIADALKAAHEGDCTGVPAPCIRCHAEEQMDIASWVFPRFAEYLQREKGLGLQTYAPPAKNGCLCACHIPGRAALHFRPCC